MSSRRTGTPERPRVLLDLSTSLAWRGRHAVGIVRTEREIAIRLLNDAELCVVPVVYSGQQIRVLDTEFARRLVSVAEASPEKPVSEGSSQTNIDKLNVNHSSLALVISPAAWLMRLVARWTIKAVPERSREEVRWSLIYARQAVRQLIYRHSDAARATTSSCTAASPDEPDLSLVVYPGPSDILFIAGLAWDVLDWQRLSLLQKEYRFRIASVMYDLIPIKFPDFLGAAQDYYYNYFLHLTDNSEKIFCISECTRADLAEFASANGRHLRSTAVIHLGANVPAKPDPIEITESAIRERLGRGRFALTVGTFEIRKNYALLIDLWEELLKDPGFDLDLVIVGMPGWCVDEVVERLERLPGFGTRVLWFKRLSDAGLSWLYEKCHVFLFPSLYEGWGLPIVEALQHGRPVIASNRGGTPEAGFGLATLLDPEDRSAWCTTLRAAALAPRQNVAVNPGRFPSWDNTAVAVKNGILDMIKLGSVAP